MYSTFFSYTLFCDESEKKKAEVFIILSKKIEVYQATFFCILGDQVLVWTKI